ncbi:hypothetical protein [Bradyrhizobium tunisiense]|uniref:hypothetical protein n=1 Tax=Bradyrhizobium tunisiense TaxID=3278709 RepID=UPI0035D8D819
MPEFRYAREELLKAAAVRAKDGGFNAKIEVRCMGHWPELVDVAATRWGMKPAEYVRRALAERLEGDGLHVGPKPTFDPAVFAGGIFDTGSGK